MDELNKFKLGVVGLITPAMIGTLVVGNVQGYNIAKQNIDQRGIEKAMETYDHRIMKLGTPFDQIADASLYIALGIGYQLACNQHNKKYTEDTN